MGLIFRGNVPKDYFQLTEEYLKRAETAIEKIIEAEKFDDLTLPDSEETLMQKIRKVCRATTTALRYSRLSVDSCEDREKVETLFKELKQYQNEFFLTFNRFVKLIGGNLWKPYQMPFVLEETNEIVDGTIRTIEHRLFPDATPPELPLEVLALCLQNFTLQELANASLVSKQWYSLILGCVIGQKFRNLQLMAIEMADVTSALSRKIKALSSEIVPFPSFTAVQSVYRQFESCFAEIFSKKKELGKLLSLNFSQSDTILLSSLLKRKLAARMKDSSRLELTRRQAIPMNSQMLGIISEAILMTKQKHILVNLSGLSIDDRMMMRVPEYFFSEKIQTLTMADQQIGDQGFKHICRHLQQMQRCFSINLKGNQITERGLASAVKILDRLERPERITISIDLQHNPIENKEGLIDLAARLKHVKLLF